MNIMFFGSGEFPLHTFKKLYQLCKSVHLVQNLSLTTTISKEIYKKKDKNLLLTFAKEQQIQYYQPITDESIRKQQWKEFINSNTFSDRQYDLGVVCNFSYMIPGSLIDAFKYGMIVIHPSLLPQFRGAAPIQRSIIQGVNQTGLSFVEISKKKFDAGKIIYQSSFPIDNNIRYKELAEKLSNLSGQKIEYLLENFETLTQNGLIQDESQVTLAPKITPEEIIPNFSNQNAQQIYNLFRGLYGTPFQCPRTKYQDKYLFLEEISIPSYEEITLLEQYSKALSASIWIIKPKRFKKFLYVRCKNSWLKIEKFRYADRSLVQDTYTFIDQFINKDELFSKTDSQGVYFFTQ